MNESEKKVTPTVRTIVLFSHEELARISEAAVKLRVSRTAYIVSVMRRAVGLPTLGSDAT